jgi:hypothetical protein
MVPHAAACIVSNTVHTWDLCIHFGYMSVSLALGVSCPQFLEIPAI